MNTRIKTTKVSFPPFLVVTSEVRTGTRWQALLKTTDKLGAKKKLEMELSEVNCAPTPPVMGY